MVKVIPMFAYVEQGPTAVELLGQIERAGRTCYKSEGKIGDGTAYKFIASLIKRGHESVLEHGAITARFIVDRGVTHELVRHRIASFSQESTRYCNYGNKESGGCITVCEPTFWDRERSDDDRLKLEVWLMAMEDANKHYQKLIELGAKPQEARAVLPQSTKAEIVATMNPREWRHFFRMRCSAAAHPDIRFAALKLLGEMHNLYPVLFDDLYDEFFPSTTMEVPGT